MNSTVDKTLSLNLTTTGEINMDASTTAATVNSTSMTLNTTTANVTSTATTTWLTTVDTNTTECAEGLTWIRDHLGDCVETTTELFAYSCAMIALALWIIGHFFLLKSRRADPDFSCYRLGFILIGGLGSVCNLVGTTLCDQLGTQILTAAYLVFSDFVLLIQWLHWWNRNRKLNKQGLSFYDSWKSPDKTRDENNMNGGGNLVLCLICPLLMTACYLPIRFSLISLPWQPSYTSHAPGRKLLMVSESATDNFGYALGFTALCLYSLGRIPTIVNIAGHKISYTVSLWFHGLVIAANVFYFISIVAYNTDPFFLTNALPWLLISVFFICFSSIIIFLVLRNRGIGAHTRPVGRRRPDGTFLLYPSEESLSNADLERSGTLRFTDDTASGKLPSIQEEPHLEHTEQIEAEIQPPFEDIDLDDEYDAETASIHSRASDFILDDEEDVYDRDEEERQKIAKQRRTADFDDDGLEWDFDDFRPKYTGSADDLDGDVMSKNPSSPSHLHTLGVPHDHGIDQGDDDEWDEERVLGEIERELKMGDDIDGDTISMEYDTADDEDRFESLQYS